MTGGRDRSYNRRGKGAAREERKGWRRQERKKGEGEKRKREEEEGQARRGRGRGKKERVVVSGNG